MPKKKKTMVRVWAVRRAVADLIRNRGCGCCADDTKWDAVVARLGKMLDVPMYDDKSGYDFGPFQTKE
jgi:hypothetical protein